MASRTAPRSRGPPRASASRASARAKVRRAFQLLAQRLPQPRLAGEIGDGVETGVDGGGIGERAAEPARKLARACASDGTVDSGEQACRARALVRAHKLEIGASCGVDEQQASRRFPARRPHQRHAANLRDLDIGEEACERGKLGLQEFAIGIERGNAELSLQRALAAGRVEMRPRDRRERRARLADDGAERWIAGLIVADQNFAGAEPGKLAGKVAGADRRSQAARRWKCRERQARNQPRRLRPQARGRSR